MTPRKKSSPRKNKKSSPRKNKKSSPRKNKKSSPRKKSPHQIMYKGSMRTVFIIDGKRHVRILNKTTRKFKYVSVDQVGGVGPRPRKVPFKKEKVRGGRLILATL